VATIREITFYETETGRSEVFEFLETLRRDERAKVMKVFETVQIMQLVPTKFLKKLTGPDKLWEIRVRDFRFLGFYANPSELVLTNAFLKQSQATPDREIAVARQRKGMHLKIAHQTK
jgi:phage-related protein